MSKKAKISTPEFVKMPEHIGQRLHLLCFITFSGGLMSGYVAMTEFYGLLKKKGFIHQLMGWNFSESEGLEVIGCFGSFLGSAILLWLGYAFYTKLKDSQ